MDNEVIEQAAKVLVEHRLQYDNTGGHRGILGGWNRYCICGWHGVDHEPSDRVFEHHVAEQVIGLLADPADRDGSYGQPTYEDLRTACHLLGERLKRAEAEFAELRATIDRVREVHRPHACTGYPDCMILFGGACAHDGHCNHCRKTWPCPTICALDGAGEQ